VEPFSKKEVIITFFDIDIYVLFFDCTKIQQKRNIVITFVEKHTISALFVSFSYKKEGRVHLPSKPLTELEGTYTF
jgi:hypothetical protein